MLLTLSGPRTQFFEHLASQSMRGGGGGGGGGGWGGGLGGGGVGGGGWGGVGGGWGGGCIIIEGLGAGVGQALGKGRLLTTSNMLSYYVELHPPSVTVGQ